MKKKPLFFIEVTDVHGGEANYSWVTRHLIRAKSELGAIQWLSKRTGINWKFDGLRYNSKSGATCAFIDRWDEDEQVHFSLDTDLR